MNAAHHYVTVQNETLTFQDGQKSVIRFLKIIDKSDVRIEKWKGIGACLNALGDRQLNILMEQISEIDKGLRKTGGAGLDAHGLDILENGTVEFFHDYINDGVIPTATCSLAQLKVAVETYLKFLQDPERKPITVPFPSE